MVNIEQVVPSDTPHILREILQSKENHLVHRFDKVNTDEMQDCPSSPIQNGVASPPGSDVNEDQSEHFDRASVVGTDEESSFLEQSRVDEAEVNDSKSDVDENSYSDVNYTSSVSKEAKRARVENIITSMQNPIHYSDPDNIYNELRRQKRKQHLPQQHETNAKVRKVEGYSFEDDLLNLRTQFHAAQTYFKQYDDSFSNQMNGCSGLDNIHRLHHAYFANLSMRNNEGFPNPSSHSSPEAKHVAPKHRRFAGDVLNITEKVREQVNNCNKGMGELDEREIEHLLSNLKSKIEDAVRETEDKLSEFFHKRNKSKEVPTSKAREEHQNRRDGERLEAERRPTTDHSLSHILQLPERASHGAFQLPGPHSAFELPKMGSLPEIHRPPFPTHAPMAYPPLSFYLPSNLHPSAMYSVPLAPPEQTEALSLVVNTPKKKRTKVTDTRLSPRAARALLQDNGTLGPVMEPERPNSTNYTAMNPPCLPTSVAVSNPSLRHSDILSFYNEHHMCRSPVDMGRNTPSSHSPTESYGFMKGDFFTDSDSFDSHGGKITDTLTPMHLRKAKLMFFYVRYPSSAILKVYFPDVQFNKNNTAQLVKWFSNFREFYYIQMEKYARQAIADGIKHADEVMITTESELYRVLNLHYNRNNQIEIPTQFRMVVQSTLREFYVALAAAKDTEPSWKKPVYKVIARMDDVLPEYFKSPNWMDQLGES